MKKLLNYSTKSAILSLLFLSLIFASCHTNRQVSDYPNFKSPDNKKFGLQAKRLKTHSHQKIKLAPKLDSISYYSSLEKIKIQKDTEVDSNSHVAAKEYISLISRKSELPSSMNNQGALIASLSVEPLITKFSFYPDTIKQTKLPAIDSSKQDKTQNPDPMQINDNKSNAKKQKNTTTFAYISFISALLMLPLLFLAPLLSISAIVFGALGKKSVKRRLAIWGMVIGIVALTIMIVVGLFFLFLSFALV